MIDLSYSEVVTRLEAKTALPVPKLPGAGFPAVSIDTRTIAKGQCFIAIRGEKFDGHAFIPEALNRGAAVIVHSCPAEQLPATTDALFLQVADTTAALQLLGHYVRRKWGQTLVAITGSMGKTTTRQFSATLLAESLDVYNSRGNLNNHFGVPLSLLELEDHHQIAVLELGMNHAGEIRRLARMCTPDIAVLTNVAPVHLEFFSGLEAIAAAKGEILEALPEDGQLIFNADDPHVRRLASGFSGRKLCFALEADADVCIRSPRLLGLDGMDFELSLAGASFSCSVPSSGRHFLYNIAAAAAVALASGIPGGEVASRIDKLQPLGMRGRVCRIPADEGGEITILDDSYNSNPEAVLSILDTVRQLDGFGRKILALGEMLELGESSPDLHRKVGQAAAALQADLLMTVGQDARFIQEGALKAGYPDERIRHFETSRAAAEFLKQEVRKGDFLLIKGSRGTHMETMVETLRTRKERQEA